MNGFQKEVTILSIVAGLILISFVMGFSYINKWLDKRHEEEILMAAQSKLGPEVVIYDIIKRFDDEIIVLMDNEKFYIAKFHKSNNDLYAKPITDKVAIKLMIN